MIKGVHHVGMCGTDPAATLATFNDFMPLTLSAATDSAWAEGPNFYLYAVRGEAPQTAAPINAIGLAHLCVQAHAAEAAQEHLERAGVRLIAPPIGLGTGFQYAYARDGEGRLIELETAPFLAPTPTGWFSHFAFVTDDLPRLTAFYAALTGREVECGHRLNHNARIDHVGGLANIDLQGAWITGLNIGLEFWRYYGPALAEPSMRQRGYTHLAFEVENAQLAAAQALALGATAAVCTDSFAAACAVRDPDGNLIYFIAFDAAAPRLADQMGSLSTLTAGSVIDHVRPARTAWLAQQGSAQ